MTNTATECSNQIAHIALFNFQLEYRDWLKSGSRGPGIIIGILKYFRGVDTGSKPVDFSCVRFLLLVEKELSLTSHEFRMAHNNYWDTWGNVAGRLLQKDSEVDASYLLDRLREGFRVNDWRCRQNIFKGFEGCVQQSCGYHNEVLSILKYVSAYCNTATTAFISELPMPICNIIDEIINAQYSIAERYTKGLFGFKCSKDRNVFLRQLLDSILLSLRFMIRAEGSSGFSAGLTWPNWRKITVDCLFPRDKLDSGGKINVTRMEKEALEEFVKGIQDIRRIPGVGNLSFPLEDLLDICVETLENYIVFKWWKRGASKK